MLAAALLLFLAAVAMLAAGAQLLRHDRAQRAQTADLEILLHVQQLEIAARGDRLATQNALLRAANDRLLTCRARE